MRIAIPVADGRLCLHFGHCERFVLIDVDENKNIVGQSDAVPPPHEPGVLPRWLAESNATTIIAGGMGMRAQQLFGQYGIEVVVGAPAKDPSEVAREWLSGTLATGGNVCDH